MGNPGWEPNAFTFSYRTGEICSGDAGGPVTIGSYPNEKQIGVISSFLGTRCTNPANVMIAATVGYAAARPLLTWVHSIVPSGGAGCTFVLAPGATPALCQTFDQPTPTAGTNSGDLNGVLWGVSRATSDNNPSQRNSTHGRRPT